MRDHLKRVIFPFIKDSSIVNADHVIWKWNFQEIPLDSRPKLAILGESVASGYFYRPLITLGKIFQENYPDEQVIDLSRVDLPFENLNEFQQLISELRPRRLIIFAGNNFVPTSATNYSELLEAQLGWIRTSLPDSEIFIIIPKFNSQWLDELTGKESLSPRILPELQNALRVYGKEVGATVIEAPSDCFLLDYCHYSWEGMKEIVESISHKKITSEIDVLTRIESLKNAFLHCYRYGQTELSLEHLATLEKIMPADRFSKFVTAFLEGIVFKGNPLFLENFLQEVFGREVCHLSAPSEDYYEMYYPEKKLFDFLLNKASHARITKQNVLDLLHPIRADVSPRKVDKQLFRAPFLHFLVDTGRCTIRFLKDEISGDGLELQWQISEKHPVRFFLNGEELKSLEFTRERLGDYNEIQLVADGSFCLEKLQLLAR